MNTLELQPPAHQEHSRKPVNTWQLRFAFKQRYLRPIYSDYLFQRMKIEAAHGAL